MKSFPNILTAAALIALPGIATAAPATGPVRNIVLVHGAFADGSGWRPLADILTKDGYTVSIVQEPETSLEDDVTATNRILDRQSGPAVLVGHSYGGAIITEAGNNAHVASLVYVAAFAPDEVRRSSARSRPTRPPPTASPQLPTATCWSIRRASPPTSRPTCRWPTRSSWPSRRCPGTRRSFRRRSPVRLGR
jgi:pimeloyl-ACP methyl ester carboxylesterase